MIVMDAAQAIRRDLSIMAFPAGGLCAPRWLFFPKSPCAGTPDGLIVQAMKAAFLAFSAMLLPAAAQPPPPHFHHLALNSTDPDAAIAFYVKQFPTTSRTSWEGL